MRRHQRLRERAEPDAREVPLLEHAEQRREQVEIVRVRRHALERVRRRRARMSRTNDELAGQDRQHRPRRPGRRVVGRQNPPDDRRDDGRQDGHDARAATRACRIGGAAAQSRSACGWMPAAGSPSPATAIASRRSRRGHELPNGLLAQAHFVGRRRDEAARRPASPRRRASARSPAARTGCRVRTGRGRRRRDGRPAGSGRPARRGPSTRGGAASSPRS